jgi:hypothetical protein
MAMTIYLKNKRTLNSSLLQKNKRSSNLTPFCSKKQKEPNSFFLKKTKGAQLFKKTNGT